MDNTSSRAQATLLTGTPPLPCWVWCAFAEAPHWVYSPDLRHFKHCIGREDWTHWYPDGPKPRFTLPSKGVVSKRYLLRQSGLAKLTAAEQRALDLP